MSRCSPCERVAIGYGEREPTGLEKMSSDREREELERVRAERDELLHQLRASESQLQTLADAVPMLAWYAGADGDIVWFNQHWYNYAGARSCEQPQGTWESLHDPDDLPRIRGSWQAALARGEAWDDVVRLRRHDGELRWFRARAVPLREPDGRVVRWFGTCLDIDDQKRAEATKDGFLARLGHELRNPIAPLLTVLQGMELSAPTSFVDERALMERQVKHLVRLVDDLLDVSRLARGTIELRREPVEMAAVVARAVELVAPLLESKAHELIVKVAPAGVRVDGDPGRLAQIVGNLLHNAATYTPDRGRIVVTCERRAGRVALSVKDSGFGIAPAMLERVFELFAQDARGLDRPTGGLGLGLAIVRSLVTMHGGTVTAHSEGVNHGSELTIELPASQLQAAGAATRGHAPDVARRILLVDDNVDYTRALAHVLTMLGHVVEVAHDGPAALAIVERSPPEVVLLDIALPGTTGYEVAVRLRAAWSPAEIPIIAVSGFGQEVDRLRSHEAGFLRHFVKPVDIAVLAETLRMIGTQKKPDLLSR